MKNTYLTLKCIVVLCLLCFCLVTFAKKDAQTDTLSEMEVVRARAILLAELCFTYETDNGTFPSSLADLYWPIDYSKYASENLGFTPKGTDGNIYIGDTAFIIRPVIKTDESASLGVNLRHRENEWWIIIASVGYGRYLGDYDILFRNGLSSTDSVLEGTITTYDDLIFYISDSDYRIFRQNENFEIAKFKEIAFSENKEN